MNELELIEPKNELKFSEQIDNETLDFIQLKTMRLAKIHSNYKADSGKELKDVQERLSKKGYGCYGEWLDFIGIKRETARNWINAHEFLNAQPLGEREKLRALPEGLLYEVARPSAPPEAVEAVLNGDITTTKEFKALKSQLHFAQKRADEAEESIVGMMKLNSELQTKLKEGPEPEIREVIKEVEKIPEDYKIIKNSNKFLKEDRDRAEQERKKLADENEVLRKQQEIKTRFSYLDPYSLSARLRGFAADTSVFIRKADDFKYITDKEQTEIIKAIESAEAVLSDLKATVIYKGEIVNE